MGLDEADGRSADRRCSGGPREILVARQKGAGRKAEDSQVPRPDPVAVDLVIPVSADLDLSQDGAFPRDEPHVARQC
jgi:hypothetical protein